MPRIVEVQIFFRRSDTDITEQINRDIHPPGDTPAAIKLAVAEVVADVRKRNIATYYYVVLKVIKSTGGFGYRTIVPKTLL